MNQPMNEARLVIGRTGVRAESFITASEGFPLGGTIAKMCVSEGRCTDENGRHVRGHWTMELAHRSMEACRSKR